MEYLKKIFWLICMVIGFIGFLITWFCLPHGNEINSIWELGFKFLIYGFIILGIAFFPNKRKYGYLIVTLPFWVFLGYIIPRISYFCVLGGLPTDAEWMERYTIIYLLLFPMINFTTMFAYRVGGGKPGKSIKISLIGMIIIFSGYLDILWHLINPVEVPDKLNHAYHIIIFFGRAPYFWEAIIFALAHIPLIILVIWLPLDKWFEKIFTDKQVDESLELEHN